MPELPEVETVRAGIERQVVGRPILSVEVGRDRVVRRTSAAELIAGLSGATIVGAHRRGKYLLCPLDHGAVLMVHLRMSGQLLVQPAAVPPPAHTHVLLTLGDRESFPRPRHGGREQLRFVDPRTFGEMVVFDPTRIDERVPELARLGPDPWPGPFTSEDLSRILHGTARQLKSLLVDQHRIAGIGNIYADEILHRARLHPFAPAGALGASSIRGLHDAMVTVLGEAVAAGGSTLPDAQYVDLGGGTGSYQDRHRVYGRAGQRCGSCGRGVIRRISRAGRSTHLCPWCQRWRRIWGDRTRDDPGIGPNGPRTH